MKQIFTMLVMLSVVFDSHAQTILKGDINGDGQVSIADVTSLVNIILGKTPPDVIDNDEHEYVDLGLPSGTLWATCNVGAANPEDYGDYFAWGETEGYNSGKTEFSWSTYKWCNGSYNTLTKYNTDSNYGVVDNETELDLEDDAAYVNWGAEWCMPSLEQFRELINNSYTTTEWITQNGVDGFKITSNANGNSIFLPSAGYRVNSSLDDAGSDGFGYYCSRSLFGSYPFNMRNLLFYPDFIDTGNETRSCGQSVRPVRLSE